MSYTVNREEIQKNAKELGIKVKFDSSTPGVLDNGERKSLKTYFEEILDEKKVKK